MKNKGKSGYESKTNEFIESLQYAEVKTGLFVYNLVALSGIGVVATGLVKLLSEKI
jgi:hypothetical protein